MDQPDEKVFAEFESLKPRLVKMSQEICMLPVAPNYRMTLAALVASHFMGTAGGLMEQIAREKGGPELDAAGWAEQVMKFVVQLTKDSRH